MTRHLLAIRLGPVQDFIAQAKRTRDLWFGSALLSDVSKAVADALIQDEGTNDGLIFPAPSQLAHGTGFANKLLALVQGDPRHLAQKAREVARQHLLTRGMTAWKNHSHSLVDPASE